ncbi:hypothetical protein GGP41_001105 [Bipolaris sorokiniana]|uniref:Uncharacterized protein n=1 Tax=Cochliobolus sativus TaxID=45130 RepID=A0A8H5ZB55_COCSA|nr:hypothetical protein GGP41_001105 [Bipolaris sorokiniana]
MVGCRSLLTVLVTLAAVVKSQQCYGVDGSLLDKSYTPCNPSAKNSGCCASGDICLSNGLCCNNPTAPRVKSPLSATLQIPAPASTPATNSPDQEPASSSPISIPPATSNCHKEKTHTAIVGAILGGLLGGIILGLVITVRWMYKRERRQRRLKEHYETQMSKTNAYRKALEETVSSARPSLSLSHKSCQSLSNAAD